MNKKIFEYLVTFNYCFDELRAYIVNTQTSKTLLIRRTYIDRKISDDKNKLGVLQVDYNI